MRIFYCLFGFLLSQKINLGGDLYLGEVFFSLFLLFNIKNIRLSTELKRLLLLLFVWCFAQLLSDIINQTETIKMIKGVLSPVFVGVILIGHNLLFSPRYRYLPLYLLGFTVGITFNRFINGHEYFLYNPWKWGLGISVLLCFLIWNEFYCPRNRKRAYMLVFSIPYILICLANSSRMVPGMVLIMTMIVCFSNSLSASRFYQHFQKSRSGVLQFFIMAIGVVYLADTFFVWIFTYEPFLSSLSAADAFKFQIQASSDYGFFIGGRHEIMVSMQAYLDKPLFGHGSWPENSKYPIDLIYLVNQIGASLNSDINSSINGLQSDLIPTHSYIMGALVWGGFFAGLFWLRVLYKLFSGFLDGNIITSALLLFLSFSLIWSIIFSPFGADSRWISSVFLWLIVFLPTRDKQSLPRNTL